MLYSASQSPGGRTPAAITLDGKKVAINNTVDESWNTSLLMKRFLRSSIL